MKHINTLIFDLGGVLIDWNPAYVYLKVFEGDRRKMKWFFDNICTHDWNEQQDAGVPLNEATEALVAKFPAHENLIRIYYDRWEEMLGGALVGTVEILKSVCQNPKYKVVALTNWSAETFPVALERFEFLHWFEGIVVSGAEKMRKPFPEIYELTLKRFNIVAENAVFIDDRLSNVEAAQKLGIHGLQFFSPEQLKTDLKKINIDV